MRVSDQQLLMRAMEKVGEGEGGVPAATKDAPSITIALIVALIKCRFVAAAAAAGWRRSSAKSENGAQINRATWPIWAKFAQPNYNNISASGQSIVGRSCNFSIT